VVRTWGFPEAILGAMAPWNAQPAARPQSEGEALFQVASFANRLCGVLQDPQPQLWEERFSKLTTLFACALEISETPAVMAEGAICKFCELAPVLGLPVRANGFVERAREGLKLYETQVAEG
jgi:hypothetical protein